MPTAKLIYDLNDVDDALQFKGACSQSAMRAALWDVQDLLRNKLKHPSDDLSSDALEALEKLRDEIVELYEEHEIASLIW